MRSLASLMRTSRKNCLIWLNYLRLSAFITHIYAYVKYLGMMCVKKFNFKEVKNGR